jgi:ABC-type nickel/cobalt efflux system permease component RcnA
VSAAFVALLAAWWIIHARRAMRKKKTKQHPALRSQA